MKASMAEARARVRETHHFTNLPLPLPPLAAPQGAFIGSLCHLRAGVSSYVAGVW
jgi:hypothetical protein